MVTMSLFVAPYELVDLSRLNMFIIYYSSYFYWCPGGCPIFGQWELFKLSPESFGQDSGSLG